MSTIPMSMSLLRDNAIISPEISPVPVSQEPEEESEEEELEEEEEPEEEEPEEESIAANTNTKTNTVEVISIRFVIVAIWLMWIQLFASLVVVGITTIFVTSAKCIGAMVVLTVIVLPVTYAISPKCVYKFKFHSLAPFIADGLYKLDYLVNRAVHYIKQKQF